MRRSRRRAVVVIAFLSVVTSGCSPAGSNSTTTRETPSTTVTTDVATTTTSSSSSTATTGPPSGDLASDPNLPPALGRAELPWDEVGPGWYVVLYDPSRANPSSAAEAREGPPVLYLVSDAGARYEVAAWDLGQYPNLIDATATSALVARHGATLDDTIYEVVDLTTGDISIAYTVGLVERSLIAEGPHFSVWPHASLTRPSGANVVVHRAEGDLEWLERRAPDGTVLSVVYEQTYVEGDTDLSWLYGSDGTSLVVAQRDGISRVTNEGAVLDELWSPPETRCDPVRWWDGDTFLAACYGTGPATAPLDEYGEPHLYYGRLWLLETDGSAGTPLTVNPSGPTIVVDFGYHDAWPTEDATFLQWSGDCRASAVAMLNLDGTGEFLPMTTPDELIVDGVRMVDIRGEALTLYGWEGCDGWIGVLFTVDLEGNYLSTLVPVVGDARGVVGVVGLTTVYP